MSLAKNAIVPARGVYQDRWVGPSAAYTIEGSRVPRELQIHSYVPAALRGVRVTAWDGGREIGSHSLDGTDGTLVWTLWIEPGPQREIEFTADKVYVPAAHGAGSDERELSFMVLSLELRPVGGWASKKAG
jgi:hypothetical protein